MQQPTFFATLANALKMECIKRRHYPLPGLMVIIDTWEDPSPMFSHYPCLANPDAVWNHTNAPDDLEALTRDDITITLLDVNIHTSHVPRSSTSAVSYPETSIGTDLSGIWHFIKPYSAPRKKRLMALNDRYVFEHKLAKIWPTLVVAPEVSIELTFEYMISQPSRRLYGRLSSVLASRFSDESIENGWINLNPHLFKDASLPSSWSCNT